MKTDIIISVSGLGYVGLPLALALARHFHVVAYDLSKDRVAMLKCAQDPSGVLPPSAFKDADIVFTDVEADIAQANFHIVAVPTPVDDNHQPDITLLRKAMAAVGRNMRRGDIVVSESTVYPGCTEDDCLPILEKESGLKTDTDFGLAYSPERVNPGDDVHTLETVVKVVSARTPATLETVARVYSTVVKAGILRAPSIKVAEAAKIIENTQRDVNIALMNELSAIMCRMGVNTADVLDAAGTKWNFLHFTPGLVGGHCIGVDPYYLDHKARELGIETRVISGARAVNDDAGRRVARETLRRMGADAKSLRVLVLGLTYKPDIPDVRNTRVTDIVDELRKNGVTGIDVVDPVASARDSMALYGFAPLVEADGMYDCAIVATAHACFKALSADFFRSHVKEGGVVADVYGILGAIGNYDKWSL